MLQQQTH